MGNETPRGWTRWQDKRVEDSAPESHEEAIAAVSQDQGVAGLVRRLNELREANRELRDAIAALDERYGMAADCYEFAPVGMCAIDAFGRVVDINLAGSALLGRSRSEIVGQPLEALVRIADRAVVRDHVRLCMSRPLRASTRVRVLDEHGAEREIDIVSTTFPCPSADAAVVTALIEVPRTTGSG